MASNTANGLHGEAHEMSVDEKLWWLERNLQEVLGRDILREVLEKGRNVTLYWGTGKRTMIL